MSEKNNNFQHRMENKLQMIISAATASSEEDLAPLFRILNPTNDRDEMGEIYTDTLGYNPITHFDRQDLVRIYHEIVEDAPGEISEILSERESEIIDLSLSLFDSNRTDLLQAQLEEVIYAETGIEIGDWDETQKDIVDELLFDEDEDDMYEEEDD